MHALATFIPLLVSLVPVIVAQAPGDETAECISSVDQPPDNRRVLMESRYYADLLPGTGGSPVWTALDKDNDGKTWGTSIGGKCQRAVVACTETPGQDNWLLTQHISKDISQENDTYPITIYVDTEWTLSTCAGTCNRTLEVHRFITDSQQLPDVSQRTGTSIGTISSEQISVTGTTSLTFTLGPTQDGFYLCIRSTGSCYTINRLSIYKTICPYKQNGLVIYSETAAPQEGGPNVISDAQCVSNASASGGVSIMCSDSGVWSGNPLCSCNGGYVEQSGTQCIACTPGKYRPDSDSVSKCEQCPDNTITTESGAVKCQCINGHYRATNEGPELACTTSPSNPLGVLISKFTDTTLTVRWLPPRSQGGREEVYYTVEYKELKSGSNEFTEAGKTLDTEYEIVGLTAVTEYVIRVIADNDVSDYDPDVTKRTTLLSGLRTGEGKPGPPANVKLVEESVLFWQLPDTPNGNINGYLVRLTYQSSTLAGATKEPKTIGFSNDTFFYVLKKRDVVGKTILQVQASTSAGSGEWSPRIVVEGDTEIEGNKQGSEDDGDFFEASFEDSVGYIVMTAVICFLLGIALTSSIMLCVCLCYRHSLRRRKRGSSLFRLKERFIRDPYI